MEFTMMVYKLSAWCDIVWRYSNVMAIRTKYLKNRKPGQKLNRRSWYGLTCNLNLACTQLNWVKHCWHNPEDRF